MSAYTPAGCDPIDDLPHDLSNDPLSLENYAWYGYDPASGFGYVSHYGTMPGDRRLWHSLIYVFLADGREFGRKDVAPAPAPSAVGTAGHRFDCSRPFEEWTLRFDGGMKALAPGELEEGLLRDGQSEPVRLDLRFAAVGPAWDPASESGHDSDGWSHLHHEQPMKMAGTATIGGEVIEVTDGIAYRDHSVGPRDLRNVAYAVWCNGVFPSGRTFGTLRVGRPDGSTTDRAFLIENGKILDATIVDMPHLDNVRSDPRTFTVKLDSPQGAATIEGALLPVTGANWTIVGPAEWALGTDLDSPGSYFLAQRLARWEWDGEIGYGMNDRGSLIGRMPECRGE